MSKYKLIKQFPLSPEVGFIADFTKIGDNDCLYDVGAISNLFECDCKDWPEFWELKKTVFTTEDNVEVDSDRKLYGVVLENGIGYKAFELAEHDYRYGASINLIEFKWFVDKGKAIAYINLNKPRYSLKDILNAKSEGSKFPTHFAIDFYKLKK